MTITLLVILMVAGFNGLDLPFDQVSGVPAVLPAKWLARPDVDWVVVEADGSRMLPVKAPAEHEPVVPEETSLFVSVVGIDALDDSIERVAHRPE
ncbi:MAG: hypothetical protein ACERLB_17060, partial [Gammaproteobacteria bacterium]